jgi:lysophospholipase L1-like esterase
MPPRLRRSVRIVAPSALLLVLYACSGGEDGGGEGALDEAGTDQDGNAAQDGIASDGANGDGASDPDAKDASSDALIDGADAADAEPPGPAAVRFLGRFDLAAAGGPKVSYPSSEILARFSGTSVSATFSDTILFNDYGPTRWEAIVDGVSSILSINRAQTTYPLASGLAAGKHTVRLIKLTEASVGTSQFIGFDFNGGTLLAPPLAPARHIEFLGDSASNGYGIEGANQNCGFTSATENAQKAYPALVAKDLNADHHNLSASGKGLLQNYYRPDTEVFSIIYPRALPFVNASVFDFSSYVPDVVWMTLGGNDYDVGFPADPNPPTYSAFEAKYVEMVTLIRTRRPNAHIFCTVAPSLQNGYPAGWNAYTNVKTAATNAVSAKNGAGDNKVYFFEFARSTQADLTGCEFHPNVAKHRAMADEAVVIIKSKTGW